MCLTLSAQRSVWVMAAFISTPIFFYQPDNESSILHTREPCLIMRPARGRTAVLVECWAPYSWMELSVLGRKKMRQEIFHNQLVTSRSYSKQSSLSLFMKKTSKCELMYYFRIGISVRVAKNFKPLPQNRISVLLRVFFRNFRRAISSFLYENSPPPSLTLTLPLLQLPFFFGSI